MNQEEIIKRYHEATRKLDQVEQDFKEGKTGVLSLSEARKEYHLASSDMEAVRRMEKERSYVGSMASSSVTPAFNVLSELKHATRLNNLRLKELVEDRRRAVQQLSENIKERRHRYAYQRALREAGKRIEAGNIPMTREEFNALVDELTAKEIKDKGGQDGKEAAE